MSEPGHRARASACRNCGAALGGIEPPAQFCPTCGQTTALHPPSAREFIHEYIGHYVALEGRLAHTLKALLLEPGRLTEEYLAGRIQRYVLPLRLYLTVSFLFFVALKLWPPAQLAADAETIVNLPAVMAQEAADDTAPDAAAEPTPPSAAGSAAQPASKAAGTAASEAEWERQVRAHRSACEADPAQCDWAERASKRLEAQWAHPKEALAAFSKRLVAMLPYGMFLAMPLLAALLKLAWRKRRMVYGEHLVFTLHLHSFAFVALALLWAPQWLVDLPLLLIVIYAFLAMHRVYGGAWWATIWRFLAVGMGYFLVLGLIAVGLATYALLF